MRWDRSHESNNLEDRRGESPPVGGGGLGMLLPVAMRFGWPGVLVVVVLYFLSRGVDCGSSAPRQAVTPGHVDDSQEELVRFVGFVFDDVQSTWAQEFQKRGATYPETRLVVFTSGVDTGCGIADASVGPFYCPLDRKVYIDLSFYRELHRRFGAPGDFAQAYVIGHEVGHHVQNVLGALETHGREGSVEVELQADCLAGAWGASAERQGLLEAGDVEEAMNAAAAIGDDTIQKRTTGRVRPESFTHGSAEQRQAAFRRGFRGGSLASCGL